ncbi:1605_t:CDS:2 [Ambispora gerdemannii]|uniref:1605_t:CDS:1 n=1 Tax=Ambispora gerdemannii TaxID=144530 RepID=A0A9N9AYB7_9GLOM|nr:1605_t:CDS:2 [Ambispora gerdemannii]
MKATETTTPPPLETTPLETTTLETTPLIQQEEPTTACTISISNTDHPNNNKTSRNNNDNKKSKGKMKPPIGQTNFCFDFIAYWLATLGSLLFISIVWYVNLKGDYMLFMWHPISMSASVFLLTQGILVLQRTQKPKEKKRGLDYHQILQYISTILGIFGFAIAVYNKSIHNKRHLQSWHAIFGLSLFLLIFAQLIFGLAITTCPRLVFGSALRAKKLYKYHRIIGYIFLVLAWVTMFTGTQVGRTKREFDYLYVWVMTLVVVFVGVVDRVNRQKVGF